MSKEEEICVDPCEKCQGTGKVKEVGYGKLREKIATALKKAFCPRNCFYLQWRTCQFQSDCSYIYEPTDQILAKTAQHYEARIREILKEIKSNQFAEPIHVPEYGREPVIVCLTVDDLQALEAKIEKGGE